jgi:hypothetical protein
MDDADLHNEIERLEARIDELAHAIESCRRVILVSRAAIAAGAVLIVVIVAGAIAFNPIVLIGAMTALIGGIVLLGSNGRTSDEAAADLKAAEALRADLIGMIGLRVVGNGGAG